MAVALLLIVALCPLPFVRRSPGGPFGIVAFILSVMFVFKFWLNTTFGVAFLNGLAGDHIATELPTLTLYVAVSISTAAAYYYLVSGRHKGGGMSLRVSFDFSLGSAMTPVNIVAVFGSVALSLGSHLNPLASPLGFRQLMQGRGMYYLLSLIVFIAYAQSIYVSYCLFAVKRHVPSHLWASLAVSLIFCTICGFGHALIFCILLPMLFQYICLGRRRVLIWVLALVPLFAMYTFIYSAYRDANRVSVLSLSDSIDRIVQQSENMAPLMNRFDYLESFTLASSYTSIKQPDGGRALTAVFFQPVPRALWPGKPEGTSTRMTKVLLPRMLSEAGATSNFMSVTEFTNALGFAGIILGGIVFGVVLGIAQQFYSTSFNNPYAVCRYLLVVFPYVLTGFISGLVADLALPLLVLNSLYFTFFIRRGEPSTEKKAGRNKVVALVRFLEEPDSHVA